MKGLLLLTAMLGAALAGTGDPICDRAEYMFFNRHLNATWLDSTYNMIAALHQADPKNEHLLYLWSRVHVQKGDDARTKAEKLANFGRAKAIAETSIELNDENDPKYALPQLDLAKVYIKQQRWLAARTQRNALLATTDAHNPADTELDDKPEARELLEQIKDK